MNDLALWLIIGFLLLVAELLTGTFYLLMLVVGCLVGAVASLFFGVELQIIAAAVVGTILVIVLRQSRLGRRGDEVASESNPDLVIDVGQTVEVEAWEEGRARVEYRGTQWDAIPEVPGSLATGVLKIKAIRGSTLVLGPQT